MNVFLDLLNQISPKGYERTWKHDVFVTIATVDAYKIASGNFSDDELIRLGKLLASELTVVHRLDQSE